VGTLRLAVTFALVTGGALLLVGAGACGTSAVDVQACRQIETARCNHAQACGISLSTPVHDGNDVDFCISFYDDQCLHGLVTQQVPGTTAVNECVAAINLAADPTVANCDVLKNPQSSPSCAFLIPGPDASLPDAADASEDGGEDSGG
jgi:hypothetical protein